jgi:hypothetical protein
MQPIDQPFRPTWDFCVAWVLLALATFAMTHQMIADETWYAYCAILILLSLFATIILYGPVLLARQIIRSGSRGWFVARVLVSVLLAAVLFAAIMFYTGHGDHASWWSGSAGFIAIAYLHWRLRDEPHA